MKLYAVCPLPARARHDGQVLADALVTSLKDQPSRVYPVAKKASRFLRSSQGSSPSQYTMMLNAVWYHQAESLVLQPTLDLTNHGPSTL